MESDPRIRVNIQPFTICSTLRCTPTQSVLSRYRCVKYIGLISGLYLKAINSQLGLSLETQQTDCLVHKQMGIAHHAQQQL